MGELGGRLEISIFNYATINAVRDPPLSTDNLINFLSGLVTVLQEMVVPERAVSTCVRSFSKDSREYRGSQGAVTRRYWLDWLFFHYKIINSIVKAIAGIIIRHGHDHRVITWCDTREMTLSNHSSCHPSRSAFCGVWINPRRLLHHFLSFVLQEL